MTQLDEYAALKTRAGFVTLPARSHLEVTGKHRHRFIHNMTTCEINSLRPGQGAFGLSVDRGGKLVAQFIAECREESLVLEVERSRGEALQAHLKSFVVADRVAFSLLDEPNVFAVIGPSARELVGETLGASFASMSPFASCPVSDLGDDCFVRFNPCRADQEVVDVVSSAEMALAVKQALVNGGIPEVSLDAYEAHRIEATVPRDGVDMGSDNIPLESRVLYSGISWDKGCYIGQEVIARMHYVGKPNRHLRRVSLDSGRQPDPGTSLYDDTERMIGWMGSSTFHAPSQSLMGLAVMKRKYAAAGQVIRDAQGHLGTVMDERDVPSE